MNDKSADNTESHNQSNTPQAERLIGVELEFAGSDIKEIAGIVQQVFGGTIQAENRYRVLVQETTLGEFAIVLDWGFLEKGKFNTMLASLDVDLQTSDSLENMIEKFSSIVGVPYEVVCPAIPIEQLSALDTLIEQLRAAEVKGTRLGLRYAFGMHLNPAIRESELANVCHVLKAYLLLEPWLRREERVDFTRRLSPYIESFPEAYMQLLLDTKYEPSEQQFVEDYLEHNSTRNRSLDLLPLLKHFYSQYLPNDLAESISGRPTYHYRLPNCEIDEPQWSPQESWKRWLLVERLAKDDKQLNEAIRAFRKIQDESLLMTKTAWLECVDTWMRSGRWGE